MMRKLFILGVMLIVPMMTLAQPLDVACLLNNPCRLQIRRGDTLIVHTSGVLPNKVYRCKVTSLGNGQYYNIEHVQSSTGVIIVPSYATLVSPFLIFGPTGKGVLPGSVSYTIRRNIDDYHSHNRRLEYQCDLV
jgi:hypothetical protein